MLLLLLLPVLFRIQREEKKIPTPLFPEKNDSKYGKKVAGKNRYCTAEVNLETKSFFYVRYRRHPLRVEETQSSLPSSFFFPFSADKKSCLKRSRFGGGGGGKMEDGIISLG